MSCWLEIGVTVIRSGRTSDKGGDTEFSSSTNEPGLNVFRHVSLVVCLLGVFYARETRIVSLGQCECAGTERSRSWLTKNELIRTF